MEIPNSAWEKLRRPFDLDQIELLPKYTGQKVNGKIPKEAYKKCQECGGYHPFPCVHLNYVGHAQITDRLNEVDPTWNWEPAATDERGLPVTSDGGMWIRLTVLGVTRWGFGDAQGKQGPDAVKEMIGDAIRNAAMRFGVATYLWSKSEKAKRTLVEGSDEAHEKPSKPAVGQQAPKKQQDPKMAAKRRLNDALKAYCEKVGKTVEAEIEELGGKEFLGKQDVEWLNNRAEFYENN